MQPKTIRLIFICGWSAFGCSVASVAATIENWNDDKSNFIINSTYRYMSPKNKKCPVRCRLYVHSFGGLFVCSFVRSFVEISIGFHLLQQNRMRLQSYLSYHKILIYGIVMLFISSNVSIQILHTYKNTHARTHNTQNDV